jgi:hypothetical protein
MFELDKLYSLLHKLNEVIPIKLAAPIELMRSDTTTDIDMVKVRFEVQISSIKDDSEVVKTIAPKINIDNYTLTKALIERLSSTFYNVEKRCVTSEQGNAKLTFYFKMD